jgi:hypothetical protein
MNDKSILVFTSRTIEQMEAEGGSAAWVIDAQRARTCSYLVCAWNPRGPFAPVNYGHARGEAFLVAPIVAVEPAPPPESPGRYELRFTEFARVSFPNVWKGRRNPVAYTTLNALGIDVDSLAFEPASKPIALQLGAASSSIPPSLGPLPISAAKPRLAAYYNVPVDAIEIIIRG